MKMNTKDIWFVVNAKNYLDEFILSLPSLYYTSLEDAKLMCEDGDVPVTAYALVEEIVRAMKKYYR